MAESVKRRVAAARLAVAFVAAGTIAGATAWAQAGPPPTAQESALNAYQKLKLGSANIKNGSLGLQDFKSGEVASADEFLKFKSAVNAFKYDIKGEISSIKGELGGLEAQIGDIKGVQGNFIKASDADARYLKLDASVVQGDGSVFTATKQAAGQNPVPLLGVPNLINVDAMPAEQQIRITNVGGSNLSFSMCGGRQAGGTLKPTESITCAAGEQTDVMQLIGEGGSQVVTLNFTFLPAVQAPGGMYTVQILIGL